MIARATWAALLLALALAACGEDEGGSPPPPSPPAAAGAPPQSIVRQIPGTPLFKSPQAPGTYVGGAGPELNPLLALVIQRGQAVVYVCDGRRLSDWFAGPVEGGRLALKSKQGTIIRARLRGGRVTGTLATPGNPAAGLLAVPAAGRTGLFLFEDPARRAFKARWIVTPSVARGLSTSATGTTTNGLTVVKTSSTTDVDARFSGVSSGISQLQSDTQKLKSALVAARSESTDLRSTLSK